MSWFDSWSLEDLMRLQGRLQAVSWIVGYITALLVIATATAAAMSWHVTSLITARRDARDTALRQQVTELRVKQAPRQLTETQRAQLASRLAGTPRAKISVSTIPGSVEARQYGEQVKTVLTEAGWEATGVTSNPTWGSSMIGIYILVKAKEAPTVPAALKLFHALKEIGVQTSQAIGTHLADDEMELIVGHKSLDSN
jgi:hypothetical protein